MQSDFFSPHFAFVIPDEFKHPPVFPTRNGEVHFWGPLMALLLNGDSYQEERVSKWLLNSDESVLYMRRLDDARCVIEWWTHRQHIFEVTEEPKVENGILKLMDRGSRSRLWLRNLNKWEIRPSAMPLR